MFAYLKNNNIEFLSFEKIPEKIPGEEKIILEDGTEEFALIDNPALVWLTEIEYDSEKITNPFFDEKAWTLIKMPKVETPEQKFSRVFTKLANPENPLTTENLEGENFDDKQIGDLIEARVFDGNPHAQMAMQAKFSAWIASVVLGKPDNTLKAEIDEKQAKINEVRVFFSLPPLTM